MPFTTVSHAAPRALFPGVTGHYAHGDRLTVGEVELASGSVVTDHQHPHEQLTYVLSGRVEFTIGTHTQVLEPGMCALIPAQATHRCRALESSRVLDVFTPAREDYR